VAGVADAGAGEGAFEDGLRRVDRREEATAGAGMVEAGTGTEGAGAGRKEGEVSTLDY